MATSPVKFVPSPQERNIIIIALDLQLKSLQRAQRAAKGAALSQAYEIEANAVSALIARVRSQELEL